MKKIFYFICLLSVAFFSSCIKEDIREAGFEDVNKHTIYDFLEENKDQFSSFIAILEKGGIYKTVSAYNPKAIGYSLFLPDNNAVNRFIEQSQQFNSLDDLLNDQDFVSALGRYHIVNKGIRSNEFPFGAFTETTMSNDYLTVSFILESDTAYYKINNQSSVLRANIEVSNGYIHIIENVLTPVVYTTYEWLAQHPDYSIFKEAIDLTGVRPFIDVNLKAPGQEYLPAVTLLVEPDWIYNKYGINSVNDLINKISPNNNEYTNPLNPLYNYIAYHILNNRMFIDDFEGVSTNYNTYSEVPVLINGLGLDLAINKGKAILETIINGNDTTYIDYVGFLYDESNIITQSGAIHFVDRLLEQQTPSRSQIDYHFREEPIINAIRGRIGTYLLDDHRQYFTRLSWSGAEVYFVREGTESSAASDDYLFTNGDFIITYTIPRIVQGRYNVTLRAESYNRRNALVEVYIDGKKMGPTVDLTSGGTASSPYRSVILGSINFTRYSEHTIEIRSLTPGRFLWDYIRFTPI